MGYSRINCIFVPIEYNRINYIFGSKENSRINYILASIENSRINYIIASIENSRINYILVSIENNRINYIFIPPAFICSFIRLFVRTSFRRVEFASKFCVKVSQVVYISATTYQKAFIFGP